MQRINFPLGINKSVYSRAVGICCPLAAETRSYTEAADWRSGTSADSPEVKHVNMTSLLTRCQFVSSHNALDY